MNQHDFAGMNKLAGSFHEAGHAVAALTLGRKLKRVTRDDVIHEGPHDARIILAGPAAVRHFDRYQGRYDPQDGGDRRNLAALTLDHDEVDKLGAEATALVIQHWQAICDVAFALDRSPNGELSPQQVETLCAS